MLTDKFLHKIDLGHLIKKYGREKAIKALVQIVSIQREYIIYKELSHVLGRTVTYLNIDEIIEEYPEFRYERISDTCDGAYFGDYPLVFFHKISDQVITEDDDFVTLVIEFESNLMHSIMTPEDFFNFINGKELDYNKIDLSKQEPIGPVQ